MDYDKLAKQFGGAAAPTSAPDKTDFDALAKQFGGVAAAQPAPKTTPDGEGFFARLAKEPTYLGAAIERGVLGMRSAVEGWQASGVAEVLEARKRKLAEATPQQKADPAWIEENLRKIAEDEAAYNKRISAVSEYNKRGEEILKSERTRPESKLMFGVDQPARGWKDAASDIATALVKDPGSVVDLAFTSGPQMLAMMAATIATRVAGAPLSGAALAGGFASKELTFGNEYAENRADGMGHEDAWKAAEAKSGIVGALDAASMKLAGKTLDSLVDAVKAAKSGHKGAVLTALKETGKGVATQASLGASGEALGSVAAGQEIDPTSVILEALGETITAPGEALSMRRRISRGIEAKPKAEAAKKQKLSPEEQAIADLEAESATRIEKEIADEEAAKQAVTAADEANQKLAEVESEREPEFTVGGREPVAGAGQPEVGGAGVGVSVPQPPATAPAAAGAGPERLATAEGPAAESVAGEVGTPAALTQDQISSLAEAGFTNTQIESAVGLVDVMRGRGLTDGLLTPIARDHSNGLTSEEIATKNKIDPPLARALQVGMGLVPNKPEAKPEAPAAETPAVEAPAPAVETPAVETPAVETPAVDIPAASSARAFNDEEIAENLKPGYKSKDKLIEMPITDFLALAKDEFDEAKAEKVKAIRDSGAKFSTLPYLYYEVDRDTGVAKVVGHEGRHRARQLLAEGYTTMPVSFRGPIRWSEQNDPEKFDYRETWPAELKAQEGAKDPSFSTSFPVSREGADAPYTARKELTDEELVRLIYGDEPQAPAETPAAEPQAPEATETPAAEPQAPEAEITVAKRAPAEAGKKGEMRSTYTMSDGSNYQIEARKDGEYHLVGVADGNESYLGDNRGEAERALVEDKNSGRLDEILGRGRPGALLSVEPAPAVERVTPEETQRLPSLKRVVDRLRRMWNDGRVTGDEFANQVDLVSRAIENAKLSKPLKPRQRGADYIRERLLRAKREGVMSSEAVALAEWFIGQNESLVDDLAIAIVKPPEQGGGVSGQYDAFMRLMRLIKDSVSDTTAVHEILHHLERMMPKDIRDGIRKEWARQVANAHKKAKASGDENAVKFFDHVFDYNFGAGIEQSLKAAIELIDNGALPYGFYQYVNPSEFWAVNGTRIVAGNYAAVRGTLLTRLKNWLRQLAQKIKEVFGLESDAPILRALNSLSKSDGKFVTDSMLFQEDIEGAPGALLPAVEQQPTGPVEGVHPLVSQALLAGDLKGMLQAIASTTSGFYSELAKRLLELNLPSTLSVGRDRARQLVRRSIDYHTASQQNRLFAYVRTEYPDLYSKFFERYDAEENLERVYEGLKVLRAYDTKPVSAEFNDVLTAYKDTIDGVNKFSAGAYFPDFDEVNIIVDRPGGTDNRILLHEVTHAATEMLLSQYEADPDSMAPDKRAAAKRVYELYNYTVKNFPGDPKTYGLKNVHEFVAEAFSNRAFQKILRDMDYAPAKISVMSRFVNAVLKLLGYDNVAANVLVEANKLFSAERTGRIVPVAPFFAPPQGPVSGKWRAAYDHNIGLIKLFNDAIKGRIPLDTALKRISPALWNSSAVMARKAYLPLAPLRYLAEITKSKFPQLVGAIRLVETMGSYRGRKMRVAEEITKDWGNLQSTEAGMRQSNLLSRVMIETTLAEEDPDTGAVKSAALHNAWKVLTPEAQSIYRRVRDFYADSIKDMVSEMKDRARANLANDPAALAKTLAAIDAQFKGIKGPYFPLRRFGDYWFQIGTNDKNKEFFTFESVTDREFAMAERVAELENGSQAERALAKTIKYGNGIGSIYDENRDPTGVLGRVEEIVDTITSTSSTDIKKELKDSLHQLMYVLLPQQSMKKMFINRKGIQGASADMLRVFAESAVHSAYQQARFKYSQDFLNNLSNAKNYVDEAQKTGLITPRQRSVYADFIREVGARVSTILSTEDKRLTARAAAAANEITFFWFLSAPATAILNLLGAAQFSFSDMGGRYGYAKTAAKLTKNAALYGRSVPSRTLKPMLGRNFVAVDFPSIVEGGNLSPLQEMFAKEFIDAQDINISLTNSLFEFGERPSALYTGRMNTLKKFASGLFHQAERFNREIVLMTAAELEYERLLNEPIKDANGVIQRDAKGKPMTRPRDTTGFSQMAFDEAVLEARNTAGRTLGDFSRAMKPRVTTSPLGSVLFAMKSYIIMSTFYMVRNIDLSLNRPFRDDEMAGMRQALAASGVPQNMIDQRIQEAQAELKSSYKEARRRMAGVLGATFLLGGLQAQPFFTAVIGTLIKAMKPDDEDDDEFFAWENWFINYMEENLGGFFGDMALKAGLEEKTAKKVGTKTAEAISGGIPAAAGAAFTERVSLDPFDLWYRSGRFSTDYRETLMETFVANAGPAVGLVMNFADAAKLMDEGRYQRAFERMLPAIVGRPVTAARLAEEGAVTNSGVTQVEEFTATELAMQALGIQPERLAQRQKSAMAAKEKEQKILSRRNSIMDRLYLERDSESGYEYALEMMQEFNDRYPDAAITAKELAGSFKRRDKAAAEAQEAGVKLNKKLKPRVLPMTNYARDEEG